MLAFSTYSTIRNAVGFDMSEIRITRNRKKEGKKEIKLKERYDHATTMAIAYATLLIVVYI